MLLMRLPRVEQAIIAHQQLSGAGTIFSETARRDVR